MLTQVTLWIGVAAGVTVALIVAFGYNKLIDNPSVVRETQAKVEAQARENTLNAIGEVTDSAQKARAMRRYCVDSGMRYDFETGKCW